MTRKSISSEEDAELKRLYDEHAEATGRGAGVLSAKGMESPEFAEADAAANAIWRRIREILGEAGSHWNVIDSGRAVGCMKFIAKVETGPRLLCYAP